MVAVLVPGGEVDAEPSGSRNGADDKARIAFHVPRGKADRYEIENREGELVSGEVIDRAHDRYHRQRNQGDGNKGEPGKNSISFFNHLFKSLADRNPRAGAGPFPV